MNKDKKINPFVNNMLIGKYTMHECCRIANGAKGLKSMSFIEGHCCFIDTQN